MQDHQGSLLNLRLLGKFSRMDPEDYNRYTHWGKMIIMQWPFAIPEELDLVDFFEAEPSDSDPRDGYWCFDVSDSKKRTTSCGNQCD